MATFDAPEIKSLKNIAGKGENGSKQHFLFFSTMFCTISKTEIAIVATFELSSANALNLIFSKNLSFCKELLHESFSMGESKIL